MAIPPLPQAAGYGVVVGLGALFAIVVVFISRTLVKYANLKSDSEEFSVARRSLGTGLTAAAVISSWTWSTTLLSSSSTAYNYGVAGPLVYAAGNTTQIVLFANLAIQLKRKAPDVHTHLELVRIRYGKVAHLTVGFFALATNILVCSSILLGGASAINAITGMNIYASLFLLPTSVVAYTLRGGLRSTILADYLHTSIIFIIIFVLWFRTYTTYPDIGSPSKMWQLVIDASNRGNGPVDNFAGSLMTVKSIGAIKFGVLSFLEYTGVVFNDASFHQKGIAAAPKSAARGYFIGGLSWFSIPFCLATTAGLAALALEQTSPDFPTYPNRMSEEEVNAGLVLVYAAQAVLGKGGSVAVLLLMFMSVTSSISAQLVAVSTIGAYDIYKPYFNKTATPDQVLKVNHAGVIAFGIFMAAFGSLLHGVGADLNLIYNMTGIFTGACLMPLVFTFFDNRLNVFAPTIGIWLSFAAGVGVWLGTAHQLFGIVNLVTVANVSPCLYGCATSIGVGLVICIFCSLVRPQHFDWADVPRLVSSVGEDGKDSHVADTQQGYEKKELDNALFFSATGGLVVFLTLFIILPFSLYRNYIFPETFFSGWTIVSVIWAFLAFGGVIVLPLWEGAPLIKHIFKTVLAVRRGEEPEVWSGGKISERKKNQFGEKNAANFDSEEKNSSAAASGGKEYTGDGSAAVTNDDSSIDKAESP
ncbi:unnamed protein product [Tilletia controversa]|uniref:Urea active transporter n=3 Tax=Tilletia TaxID=13289 RepID=A0A8X7T1C6_9BASI|nr:hypothetical protein CF336_g131 [Tilletia laevis]KAE8206104.1 hypothetical protein CF328_g112 [Tilletia controversa]KAE8265670.1 hypothetical protein A4X03_0g100 [Tilletia caries]KAE8255807.1 hypothetical protein A4X06_0g245 [Tilletia controversa]CAD6899910.1 unnamed protein product [Tilletia caries]